MTFDPSSDEPKPSVNDPSTTPASKESPDLVNELREMGQQLEAMFRTFVESDRAKQLQRDLAGGVQEITKQVQLALKSAQENPRFQQAEERGRQMLNQAQQSKIVNDVQETLMNGIGQLNQQIRRATERLDQENQANSSGSTASQQVPIEVDETSAGDEAQPGLPPFERFDPNGPDVTSVPGAAGIETQRLDIDDDVPPIEPPRDS